MARFPFQPGAGAKGIKNPVYWSRLHLQENRRRGGARSAAAQERQELKAQARLVYLMAMFYDGSNELFGVLNDVTSCLTEAEYNRIVKTQAEARQWAAELDDSPSVTQSDLNKLATRIKRYFLVLLKLIVKYQTSDDQSNLKAFVYDTAEKEFILQFNSNKIRRCYFLGQVDVSKMREIRELFYEAQASAKGKKWEFEVEFKT